MLPPGAEDPIGAVFDLSDRTAQMAPTIRRMYRYTATVVVVYLLIMAFLLLDSLAHDLILAGLAIVALLFGIIALSLLRETDRFFRTFSQRHRAIRLFRDADPAPKIPEGRTPAERLARHLAQGNPRIDELLREDPSALRLRVDLPGDRRTVPFDLALVAPGSAAYRAMGWGRAGFSVLARLGPETPTPGDLERFGHDVEEVARHLPGLPVRAILLRTRSEPLSDATYDYAVGHPLRVRRGMTEGRCSLEIISEKPDGTYDFVPFVLGVP